MNPEQMTQESPSRQATQQANLARATRRTALICVGVVTFMTAAAFAAVPLYDLFCRVTGFGGTPMVRAENTTRLSDRRITVRFDANVAPNLPWRFVAEETTVDLRLGETRIVSYKVTNTSDRPTTGMATFNVQPAQSGAYFVKIQCFCFNEHTLQPGETMEAPVVFYVDPEIEQNAELKKLKSITLSYTYFPAKGGQPVAEAGGEGPKPKL
jgi:cytochrome c oxidase assembly protein subunit 11